MERDRFEDDLTADDRSSRVERVADDMGEETGDLGRAQADGNLGNERVRNNDEKMNRDDRSRGDNRDF